MCIYSYRGINCPVCKILNKLLACDHVLQVKVIDTLPDVILNVEEWFNSISVDELDAGLLTLVLSLLTVLYIRQRHRGMVVPPVAPIPQ